MNADGICYNVLGLRVFAVGHLGFLFFVGECCCQFEYSHKTIPLVGEDHFKPTKNTVPISLNIHTVFRIELNHFNERFMFVTCATLLHDGLLREGFLWEGFLRESLLRVRLMQVCLWRESLLQEGLLRKVLCGGG